MRAFLSMHKYYLWAWIIGLCAALWIGYGRIQTENTNHAVEMVYDYGRVLEYAAAEQKTTDEMLDLLGKAGITSFAVYDETPKKLQDEGYIRITQVPDAEISYLSSAPQATPIAYVWRGQSEIAAVYYRELTEDLQHRLPPASLYPFTTADRQEGIAVIAPSFDAFMKLNTGISSARMRSINERGFGVVVRPTNYAGLTETEIERFWQRVDAGGGARAVMFVGAQALGYPNGLDEMAHELMRRHLPVAVIEAPNQLQFEEQKGVIDLWRTTGLQGIRAYSMYRDELVKLDAREASQRHFISDIERNIRLNLFASYKRPIPGKTVFESDLEYIGLTSEKLRERGFTLGKPGLLTWQPQYRPAQLLVLLGIVAVTMMALRGLISWRRRTECWVAAGVYAGLALWLMLSPAVLPRQIAALLAAVMTPVAVMYAVMQGWRQLGSVKRSAAHLVGVSLLMLSGATLMSLSGGWLLGGILTTPEFLLEIEIFRGVKLAFVLPVLLISCLYLRHYATLLDHPADTMADVWVLGRRALTRPVTIGTMVLLAFLAIGALIFVGRSGHTGGIPVAGAEIRFRRILETLLSARPRFKELLIGHPAFLAVAMVWQDKWPRWIHFLLVVAAGIGQASIVETFAHMRSPLLMSTERGINGWLVGIAVGLVALVICHVFTQIAAYGRARYEKN